MDEGKVLFFDPIALTTLCNTTEPVLVLFVALATEDKVPYIIVRAMMLIKISVLWMDIMPLTFRL